MAEGKKARIAKPFILPLPFGNLYVRVYLTNLGKYVEGYLVGKWVD
jgi:hypothetical protein